MPDSWVVWLGEPSKDSDLALDLVEFMAKRNRQPNNSADDSLAQDESVKEPIAYSFVALMTLLCRPWFRRIWVVQEVALASSVVVVCGERFVAWETLVDGTEEAAQDKTIYPRASLGDPQSTEVVEEAVAELIMAYGQVMLPTMQWVKMELKQRRHIDMSTALCSFKQSHASDPHDMVYGMLGMMGSPKQSMLKPDYRLPVPELYLASTLQCIAMESSLKILAIAGIGYFRYTDGLPSWAPDYNDKGFAFWDNRTGSSGGMNLQYRVIDHQKLCLTGYLLDTVDRVGPVWDEGYLTTDPWAWILEVEDQFYIPGINYEAFWKTLCTDKSTFSMASSNADACSHILKLL